MAPNSPLELAQEWSVRFAQALESLIGSPVAWAAPEMANPSEGEDWLYWRQQFSGGDDAWLLVATSHVAWRSIANKVLEAAGLDSIDEEEAASAYYELLSQAAAGLAHALSARTEHEIACLDSSRVVRSGDPHSWTSVKIPGMELPSEIFLAFGAALQHGKTEPPPDTTGQTTAAPGVEYRTFDLLLDVELPVSVSFGRSQMPIKDVLQLTTGSVIELDRAVTEPVELVVNNRVIARGEVVVVDGNYGVRIAQIMSREERMRSFR
jgi:flagellar motor switch protein FliN/FliY